MADTSQTLALLALGQKLRGNIVRTINRRAITLRIFPWLLADGQNCAWAVEGDGQVGENYAEGADAANFGSDSQVQALLNWGHYRSNFHVTGTARRAARRAAAGPMGIQNLIGRNMTNSSAKVASIINVAAYNGAGTGTTMAGFDVAIGSTTNTYGTIDRTVGANSFWLPTVVDPGSLTKPTFAQMRDDRRKIYVASGEYPDIGLVSPDVFNAIGGLYDNNRRWVTEVETPRGTVILDAGFKGLELDGMTFIQDKDATSNKIYYVNSNYVHFEYLPPDEDILQDMQLNAQADDGWGATPLGITCEQLSKTGDSSKYQCLTNVQLVVTRPNACGVRVNVDPS